MRLITLIALTLSNIPSDTGNVDDAARSLISAFLAAEAALKDTTYTLDKKERMRDGEMVSETLSIKLRPRPYAVYMAKLAPSKGLEALYVHGKNDNEMTAHPGSFPDVTVNLNPEGGTAMKNQHFPIYATGLNGVKRRLKKALKLAEKRPDKINIRTAGKRQVAGVATDCLEIDAEKLGGYRVAAKDDETLFALARRVGSWPYLIFRHNPDIDDIDDELDEGQKVFVPSFYAKRVEYCFDATTGLVASESYFDKHGLYERYETRARRVNVGLKNRDFDPDNGAYNF